MFLIETSDGQRISEDNCYWHDLPKGIAIKKIGVCLSVDVNGQKMLVADDFVEGFDEYGFQKFDSVGIGGGRQTGAQIIAVSHDADKVMVLEVNLSTGHRHTTWKKLSELTYRPDLLRPGVA
jgi:hypothetical protein